MSVAEKNLRPHLTVLTNDYSTKSDAELVVLCQQKDQAAFKQLVKRHERTVYALLYRLAPDWRDTSDLAQEVFIRMWARIDTLRSPNAFKSWMSQIVTNLFYDELRKRPRQLPTVSMDSTEGMEEEDAPTRDIPDSKDGPEQLFQRDELATAVSSAIQSLPEQFRTTIILRELQGLAYEEIAHAMGCDVGTVKSRISRARGKIQTILAPYLASK
jgi:RNA polymerase sigma-70 factor, ECF subfamily